MEHHDGLNDDSNVMKRGELTNNNFDDGDQQEDLRIPQNCLAVIFGGEVLLPEALPYLDTVSIVDKKIVCRQWREKCDVVINNKGRREKKRFFDNAELRGAVIRFCVGRRDIIENIAEEYGYPIGKWDVSRVEDFSRVLSQLGRFNEDIGAWDVRNATDMKFMFCRAESFNQNLSGWDVSNVMDMNGMFSQACAFNGDVSTWDTSSVTNMGCMFEGASTFNGDISAWDTSSATNMRCMFGAASAFDGDISAWDVSSVNNMRSMFQETNDFN